MTYDLNREKLIKLIYKGNRIAGKKCNIEFLEANNLYKFVIDSTSFSSDLPLASKIKLIIKKIKRIKICKNCQSRPAKFNKRYENLYSDFCSQKCANTSKITIEKSISTNKKNYNGFRGWSSLDRDIRLLSKNKMLTLCKDKNFIIDDILVELQIKLNCTNRYKIYKILEDFNIFIDKDLHNKTKGIINKRINSTNLYGCTWPTQKYIDYSKLTKENIEELHIKQKIPLSVIAKDFNISASFLCNYVKEILEIDAVRYTRSSIELNVCKYLDSLCVKYITSDRKTLSGLELDILLPDHKLAIEINGEYWHSTNATKDNKNRNRHLIKTDKCEKLGIHLFHINVLEWQDETKSAIWKSMIKNKLMLSTKIAARKTKFTKISTDDARKFCEENHMQGYAASSKKYGLYYNNELFCVMTTSKSRFNIKENEIVRFCSKTNYIIVGGFSKILKHIGDEKLNLVSYGNRRWVNINNNIYMKFMQFIKKTNPNYKYFTADQKMLSRQQCQKRKLKDKLKEFDNNISEEANMFNNGYRKIYDSGNLLYTLVKSNH